MKGLLRSKRFTKLLKKWLFMYVGVMALLTTVVTYSRYISAQTVEDSARIVQFKVDIHKTDENFNLIAIDLPDPNYRTTSKIYNYFIVDTTKIEVDTEFYLTFEYDSTLFSLKVYDVTTNSNGTLTSMVISENPNLYKVYDNVEATKGRIAKYKVEATYIGPKVTNSENMPTTEIVKVGFSAKQQSKGGLAK